MFELTHATVCTFLAITTLLNMCKGQPGNLFLGQNPMLTAASSSPSEDTQRQFHFAATVTNPRSSLFTDEFNARDGINLGESFFVNSLRRGDADAFTRLSQLRQTVDTPMSLLHNFFQVFHRPDSAQRTGLFGLLQNLAVARGLTPNSLAFGHDGFPSLTPSRNIDQSNTGLDTLPTETFNRNTVQNNMGAASLPSPPLNQEITQNSLQEHVQTSVQPVTSNTILSTPPETSTSRNSLHVPAQDTLLNRFGSRISDNTVNPSDAKQDKDEIEKATSRGIRWNIWREINGVRIPDTHMDVRGIQRNIGGNNIIKTTEGAMNSEEQRGRLFNIVNVNTTTEAVKSVAVNEVKPDSDIGKLLNNTQHVDDISLKNTQINDMNMNFVENNVSQSTLVTHDLENDPSLGGTKQAIINISRTPVGGQFLVPTIGRRRVFQNGGSELRGFQARQRNDGSQTRGDHILQQTNDSISEPNSVRISDQSLLNTKLPISVISRIRNETVLDSLNTVIRNRIHLHQEISSETSTSTLPVSRIIRPSQLNFLLHLPRGVRIRNDSRTWQNDRRTGNQFNSTELPIPINIVSDNANESKQRDVDRITNMNDTTLNGIDSTVNFEISTSASLLVNSQDFRNRDVELQNKQLSSNFPIDNNNTFRNDLKVGAINDNNTFILRRVGQSSREGQTTFDIFDVSNSTENKETTNDAKDDEPEFILQRVGHINLEPSDHILQLVGEMNLTFTEPNATLQYVGDLNLGNRRQFIMEVTVNTSTESEKDFMQSVESSADITASDGVRLHGTGDIRLMTRERVIIERLGFVHFKTDPLTIPQDDFGSDPAQKEDIRSIFRVEPLDNKSSNFGLLFLGNEPRVSNDDSSNQTVIQFVGDVLTEIPTERLNMSTEFDTLPPNSTTFINIFSDNIPETTVLDQFGTLPGALGIRDGVLPVLRETLESKPLQQPMKTSRNQDGRIVLTPLGRLFSTASLKFDSQRNNAR